MDAPELLVQIESSLALSEGFVVSLLPQKNDGSVLVGDEREGIDRERLVDLGERFFLAACLLVLRDRNEVLAIDLGDPARIIPSPSSSSGPGTSVPREEDRTSKGFS